MFFSTLYGVNTESAKPLLNLLDILTVENTFKLKASLFAHNWHHQSLPPIFNSFFLYSKDVHSYNTRYASKNNFYKLKSRTNTGKQTIASLSINIWHDLPTELKQSKTYSIVFNKIYNKANN